MESIPSKTLAWRLYGAGLENFGNQDAPDNIDIRPLKDDEILTKVEAIGLCFSDIKIIRLGGNHLKLWEKDLKNHPLIIGHEAILTILKKGPGVPAEFEVGKRYLVQPDIYIKGRCCAYGYGMDGGLTQYSIIDHRVWRSEDGGSYLLECPENLPSASAALMEPWTCVRAAYHIPHRTTPVDGGALLLVTQPGNTKTYKLGKLYAGQSKVVALNFSDAAVAAFEKELGKPVVKATTLPKDELFDDIVYVDLKDKQLGEEAQLLAADKAIINFIGDCGNDEWRIDVGALHYKRRWYQGAPTGDLDAGYATPRRNDLLKGGAAWFPGGAGAMGQMHVELAIISKNAPSKILVTDIDDARIEHLRNKLASRAAERNIEFKLVNPNKISEDELHKLAKEFAPNGFSDIIILVPSAAVIDQAMPHLADGGLMNVFAGIPAGEASPIPVNRLINKGLRFTGSSGSTTQDMIDSLRLAAEHEFEPQSAMAAIAGFNAVKEGLTAVSQGKFPGKVVILPACVDMPLMPLDKEHLPAEVVATLDKYGQYTMETEKLLHKMWK